jgi:hypothetical protein
MLDRILLNYGNIAVATKCDGVEAEARLGDF